MVGKSVGSSADHPHAYGDKVVSKSYPPYFLGSSPRVWGQAHRGIMRPPQLRIIPTRMGTRVVSADTVIFAWDHPHAYGDKVYS